MIRAIVREGKICPLDPLPEEWSEGRVLEIEGFPEPQDGPDEIDRWLKEMDELAAQLDDPEDWRRLDESLAEQRRLSKEQMRKQMGLSE